MPKDIKSNSPLPVLSGYPVLRCFKRDFVFFLYFPNAERFLWDGYECSEILGGKLKWMHSN